MVFGERLLVCYIRSVEFDAYPKHVSAEVEVEGKLTL